MTTVFKLSNITPPHHFIFILYHFQFRKHFSADTSNLQKKKNLFLQKKLEYATSCFAKASITCTRIMFNHHVCDMYITEYFLIKFTIKKELIDKRNETAVFVLKVFGLVVGGFCIWRFLNGGLFSSFWFLRRNEQHIFY